jgi:GTP cyclohydrolase I
MKTTSESAPVSRLADTQNQADHRGVVINEVGVSELKWPFRFRFEKGREFGTHGIFRFGVKLDADLRGTHMSRFVENLKDFECLSVEGFAECVHALLDRLQAQEAFGEVSFQAFQEKQSPVSRQKSWIDYEVTISSRQFAKASVEQSVTRVGIKAPIATLCPCSKEISERGAHNQRGYLTCQVEGTPSCDPAQLFAMAEGVASAPLYALLKRQDEKHVTEQAYDNPSFVEDVVRDMAITLKKDKKITWFRIEAENLESIHSHNAYAVVEQ